MGLDFYITAQIYDKRKKDILFEYELGYWRKCFGLTDRLMSIAKDYKIEPEISGRGFSEIICKPSVITKVIDTLCKSMTNMKDTIWMGSIWDNYTIRKDTLDEIKKLMIFQTYYLELNEVDDDIDDDDVSFIGRLNKVKKYPNDFYVVIEFEMSQ